jgi:hypothetical protein
MQPRCHPHDRPPSLFASEQVDHGPAEQRRVAQRRRKARPSIFPQTPGDRRSR